LAPRAVEPKPHRSRPSPEREGDAGLARLRASFVAAAGLPRHRLYDLRHTFATHLLADGAPITYVAAQLGHRKPTTTLAFYAHWIPRGDKTYIDRLAAARLTVAPKAPPTPPDDVLTSESRHRSGTISTGVDMNDAELLETSGAGGGSRTRDLLITNQLLCL